MEYQVLKPAEPGYPSRLKERLGTDAPALYFSGPLDTLSRWTLGVICGDMSSGLALMATNQLLFTIREYDLNYVGGWHSVIETEIFRLGFFTGWSHKPRKNSQTVTLFSAKGLAKETLDSYLLDRFWPPLDKFPERPEIYKRAGAGKLLILSITPPEVGRTIRKNVVARNWVACNLADAVFIPYANKGSKTYALTKRLLKAGITCFTSDDPETKELQLLGVPAFTRKSVGPFLESLGAKLPAPESPEVQRPLMLEPPPPTSGNPPLRHKPSRQSNLFAK